MKPKSITKGNKNDGIGLIQKPRGHEEDRASFPNQIQYKVSKIHSPNPTLEKRKGGREEGREGARERGEACVLSKQKRER